MPDETETKRVQATHGEFAGQLLDLPTADAEQAISDGWAVDPFAPADPDAEPEEFDQDKHDKANVAAAKAARKLRGEKEEETATGEAKPAKRGRPPKSDTD